MRRSRLSPAIVFAYQRLPMRRRLLSFAVRLEGGQMTSVTLRLILAQHYGVTLGDYAYGALAEPGRADSGTTIGRYVSVGPDVRRFGAGHPLQGPSMHPYWYNPALGYVGPERDVPRTKCEIGHDAWIGAGTTILPGCTRIGVGAVVGAASVVTADVPDFGIVVGNPARLVRYRFSESVQDQLRSAAPWQHDPIEAKAAIDRIIRETEA